MKLGNFSLSLSVKNLAASQAFYEKLGFTVFGGDSSQNWLIMQNEQCTIGLFEGMFEKNMLTFNPGWNHNAEALESFDDIRDLQKNLKAKGISIEDEIVDGSSGPASFSIIDPDGNPILFDQHI